MILFDDTRYAGKVVFTANPLGVLGSAIPQSINGNASVLDQYVSRPADNNLLFRLELGTLPTDGVLAMNEDGSFQYDFGTDTSVNFTFDAYENNVFVETETVNLTSGNVNTAPVADAGSDQTGITAGATVTLDGSASNDADSDTITFAWTAPNGVTLSDATIAGPTFTAPSTGSDQTLTFSLVVNDGTEDSAANTVDIQVNAFVNSVPSVEITGSDTATAGAVVALARTITDSDGGDSHTNVWRVVSGNATLSSTTTATIDVTTASLTAENAVVIGLIVNDGTDNSAEDTFTITVAAVVNTAPQVNITGTATGDTDDTFTLTANITDPDADSHTYTWRQMLGNGSLSATDTASIVVTPTTAETIQIGVIVNDGTVDSVEDTFDITVSDAAPSSDAFDAISKAEFTLDGEYRLSAFVGRSNIETLKFKVSGNLAEINTISGEYFDFDSNDIVKIEVKSELGNIDSTVAGITFVDDSLSIEFGKIPLPGNVTPRIVIYVGNDTKGIVIAGPNMPAAPVLFMHSLLN